MSLTLDGSTGISSSGAITTSSSLTTSSNLTTGTGAIYDGISRGAAVTASGTSITFTSIPSWAKRITFMFSGLIHAAAPYIIVGTGATPTYVVTGYNGFVQYIGSSAGTGNASTSIPLNDGTVVSGTSGGTIVFYNVSGNTWTWFSNVGYSSVGGGNQSYGSIALSAALTAIQLASASAFTGGLVNILYE